MVRPWKSTSHNKITRVSPPQAGMIMRLAKYDLVWSAAALLLFGASSVPAQTPFYGYYDGTNTIFGPPYNYTNIYRVEKGTPTSEIADILANGQRLALFDVWINPTPADPGSRINSLPVMAYKYERYRRAGVLEFVYMIDSPYSRMTRAELEQLISVYRQGYGEDFTLALNFDGDEVNSGGSSGHGDPVFLPGFGVPDDLDLAGLVHYPFFPDGFISESDFNSNMQDVLDKFRSIKSPDTDIYFVGQGFSGDGFLNPPTLSPHWYKQWVQSESDIKGIQWFKWADWPTGQGSGSKLALAAQQAIVGADLGISTNPTPIPMPPEYHVGLIDRWTFNEGSGNSAASDGEIGLIGTFTHGTPVWVDTPGNDNSGLQFVGNGVADIDRVTMVGSHRYGNDSLTEMSVEVWFQHTGSFSGAQTLISKKNPDLYFRIDNGRLRVGTGSTLSDSATLDNDTWYHAVYVVEGTEATDFERLYIDGVQVDSRPSQWQGLVDENVDVTIGDLTGLQAYRGIIDEVRIHDVGLSPNDIMASFLAGPVRSITGDFNSDTLVDDQDIDLLRQAIAHLSTKTQFDVNNDTFVNSNDVTFLITDIIDTSIADVTLDKLVDAKDLAIIRSNLGTTSADILPWSQGNVVGDGYIDDTDVLAMRFHFGFENLPASPAVPEPATAFLLGCGFYMAWGRFSI